MTQGVILEEHSTSVECVTSSDKLPPAVSNGDTMKLMSFPAFSAASVKSKVRCLRNNIAGIYQFNALAKIKPSTHFWIPMYLVVDVVFKITNISTDSQNYL